MTTRRYYDDSYTVEFPATVVERLTVDGRPALILDQTYFYPASGGQPSDTGFLDDVRVLSLQTRESDAAVIHVLEAAVDADHVIGRVDWERRFDHMQHHTGQHILTQAFVQVAGANTVGFHLSPDSVTIDLDRINLSPETVADVESLANQIIWQNRAVSVRLVKPDEAEGVRMRKMPEYLLTEGLRVIDIDGFDVTACGGTHVARTGDVGLIKVLKLERRGDKTRVEFRCGGRALQLFQTYNAVINGLVAALTCKPEAVEEAVARMQEDIRQLTRSLKTAAGQLADFEAEHLLRETPIAEGVRVVKKVETVRDPGDLKQLAGRLTEGAGVVALLGTAGEKAHLVFACSADLPHDMNALLKDVLPLLGSARGGGQPGLAQGGGVPADPAQVKAALDAAEAAVRQRR